MRRGTRPRPTWIRQDQSAAAGAPTTPRPTWNREGQKVGQGLVPCRNAISRRSLGAGLSLLTLLAGCGWACVTAPILEPFAPGARAAVVLFHVAWGTEADMTVRPWGPNGFGPPPLPTRIPIEHPAAVYEAFREGLGGSGSVTLVSDDRLRKLPHLTALVPSLTAPSYSSPAPSLDARSFPFPIEVGDAPIVEKRWGLELPVPMHLAKPTELFTYHLAPVSPRMPTLARELGADGLVEVFLRPVFTVTQAGSSYSATPLRIYAMVTVFGPDGRRRYENVFRSVPLEDEEPGAVEGQASAPGGAVSGDLSHVQRRAEAFARKLGARVASEGFGG
ncbi:MAG: hypothetical protein ACYCWW_17300 [Deltaproteobacteria bacterium]